MARELGGSQISALLESVPGIINVLRNPVADALVGMIRAGAGLEEFSHDHANELIQYAVRRGLVPSSEGEQVLEEVGEAVPKKRSRSRGTSKKTATRKPVAAQTRPATKTVKRPFGQKAPAKKVTGRPVKKAAKRSQPKPRASSGGAKKRARKTK
jgi:hypothetical protein